MEQVTAFITSFFITLQTIFGLFPSASGFVKSYSPEKENPELNIVLLADIHTDGNFFRDRTNILRETFAGIHESREKIDAVICAGDITNGGHELEYVNLSLLKLHNLKGTKFLPSMGNHDSWRDMDTVNHTDENYELAKSNYLRFLKVMCGVKTDTPYFCTEIKGCGFIMVGTEDTHQDEAIISDTQISFIDSCLAKYENSGKPVFVICHQPLNGHNGCDSCWSDSAEKGSEIQALLDKYSDEYSQPIFFISGHVHTLGENNFEQDGNIYYLNLPSTEYTSDGGIGYTLEMYEDEIYIRGRNFRTDEWLENQTYVINTAA